MESARTKELNRAYERLSKLIGRREDSKARALWMEMAKLSRGDIDRIPADMMTD